MSLRSPAELYLKYLLCHPDKYSNEVVKQTLEARGIYFLGDPYLEGLRLQLVLPDVFRPKDVTHSRSLRFLIREGIRTLFHPTAATKMAFRLLEAPRAREFTEAMILSHAPAVAIAARVRETMLECTPEGVEEYKKYFWNIDLLNSTQIRLLLGMELNQNIKDDDSVQEKDRKKALKKASYLDPRQLAADLPFSPLTALMAQTRMGLMPNRLELAKILQATQAMASLKTLEAVMYGSPQDSQKALNFSHVVRNMAEVLETVVKPDEHLREQLQAIALRTESAAVPSIHKLSAGKHTVDLQPQNLQVRHEQRDEEPLGDEDGPDE